jgi:hypothetical protein
MQKTIVQTASSGKEYRLPQWRQVRWKYKLDWGYLFDDYTRTFVQTNWAAQQLMGFFNQVQGQYGAFLYLDPYDNQIQQAGTSSLVQFGTGDGTTQSWNIIRLQFGNVEQVQYSPSPNIYFNSVLQSLGVTYTLPQQQPAIVRFNSIPGPGSVLAATGQFYQVCRFTADSYDFIHDSYGIWTMQNLEFESVLC